MLNNFIYAQTKALFEEHLLAGNILDEAVVFIEDTKEIWNHGTYFGGADVSKLESSIEGLSEAIAALQSGKQDTITDLETIRSNANKGATAVQATSLASVAMSGNYEDLINKPEIPSAVTETTVSDWGFTKNTGTYVKPEGGIPSSDLAESIQTTLTNAVQAPLVYNEELGGDVRTVSDIIRMPYVLSDTILSEGVICSSYNFDMKSKLDLHEGKLRYTTNNGDIWYTLATTTDIPTKTSKLENDSAYVTESELTNKGYSTVTYVDEKVAALVDGAPETLNTLDELAAALKDNADIVDVLNNSIGTKQNTIEDLDAIRSGAAAGATALQEVPEGYATESWVGAQGFLTAHQDITGKQDVIEDLATIREGASKGATALQSFTETDPIFSASVAANIKESDITNWNSKTSNTGTVTGIKMNGSTKGTSGVVDLGTVITSHQDISGKADVSDLNAHKENTTIHVTSSDKSKWNSAESNAKTYADSLNTSMDARVGDIEETLPETERRLTTVENYTVPDARNKVLWIGTSIPAGDIQHGNNGGTQSTTTNLGSNNYPKMVADALGFTLYNNARGSSFVCFYPPEEDGTNAWAGKDWSEYSSEVWKGYSLSASFAQVDEKFGPNGLNCPQWLINNFKSYSYESLIIPYIDGTLASCDTVVIDHGYNDRSVIINEASWHPGDGETQFTTGAGRNWLLKLQDPFETTNETESYFQGKWWNDESVSSKKHYMSAIIFLVKKIWAVNPKIKIIIGNYFTSKSNVFGAEFGNDRLGEFVHLANSAIASWLRVNCVEVWHHTGLYNRNLPAGNDYQLFCPDGVHPHSDSTGHSNKIIAGVYINAIRGTLYI